jgi:hypothetical protein
MYMYVYIEQSPFIVEKSIMSIMFIARWGVYWLFRTPPEWTIFERRDTGKEMYCHAKTGL